MLHLIYYLNCLAGVEDVREQNRQAFELHKLSSGENLDQQEDDEDVFEGLPLRNTQPDVIHEESREATSDDFRQQSGISGLEDYADNIG